jgi:hypothetical protein
MRGIIRRIVGVSIFVALSALLGMISGSVLAPEPAAADLCANNACDPSHGECLSFPGWKCRMVAGGCWDIKCTLPE